MVSLQLPMETIDLPHKSGAPISYQFVPGHGSLCTTHLIVFLNGLILAKSGWEKTMACLTQKLSGNMEATYPSMLSYDRYGQGQSARDPSDGSREGYGHDATQSVRDLDALIRALWTKKRRSRDVGVPSPHLVFVGNSIGCVIGRLYAQTYPGAVSAMLFLDSNMANSDFLSIFPDPDSSHFDPSDLPSDVTIDELRGVRKRVAAIFLPSVRNPEGLDRRNLVDLLPYSDSPPIRGTGGRGPLMIVAEHDWDVFADENLRGSLKCPKSLVMRYLNPAWRRYNEGLVRLTENGRAEGPLTAVGCGHFIQRDDPEVVAGWLWQLIQKLQ
jgi:pimeloyl-ACP methyl ester carboxylesterase